MSQRDRIKVIAIVGTDRSGSTLLDKIISANPGVVSVGEVHRLFNYWTENHPCTCGAPFDECEFWRGVRRRLSGTGFRPEMITVLGWKARSRLLLSGVFLRRRSERTALAERARACAQLYRAVLAESGAQVIVDSSKDASRLYMLRQSGHFDITPIYITRPVEDYAVSLKTPQMNLNPNRSTSVAMAFLRWSFRNLETRLLLDMAWPGYTQASYVSLARDPAGIVAALSRRIGIPLVYDQERVKSAKYHFLGGNFMKFKKFDGIRPDVKPVDQVLSSPLLRLLARGLNRCFVRNVLT